MGSKRVGLARTQALIENLKREIDLNSSSFVEVAGISTNAQSTLTNLATDKGTDLANDTDTVTLDSTAHGKTFVCLLANAGTKTVNLPPSPAVGTTIKIIQGADLVASGVLRVNSIGTDTLGTNSYALGYNSSRYLAPTRPIAANNRITITGANTNSAWGIGSTLVCTYVASGEWYFEAKAEPLGTGNDAIAWSTAT